MPRSQSVISSDRMPSKRQQKMLLDQVQSKFNDKSWAALEKELGRHLSSADRNVIVRFGYVFAVKDNLGKAPLTTLRREIQQLKRRLLKTHKKMEHLFDHGTFADTVTIDGLVTLFSAYSRLKDTFTEHPFFLFNFTLIELIQTCNFVERNLGHSKDENPVGSMGLLFSEVFRRRGLPHRIPKDFDKPQSPERLHFLRFYRLFLKTIGCAHVAELAGLSSAAACSPRKAISR